MTVKERLHEINEQMIKLSQEERRLRQLEIEEIQDAARANIGRCFKLNNQEYAAIFDVPKQTGTMTGIRFNEYEYPAIIIDLDDDPGCIVTDTVHIKIANQNGEEISKKEFLDLFDEVCSGIREVIENGC